MTAEPEHDDRWVAVCLRDGRAGPEAATGDVFCDRQEAELFARRRSLAMRDGCVYTAEWTAAAEAAAVAFRTARKKGSGARRRAFAESLHWAMRADGDLFRRVRAAVEDVIGSVTYCGGYEPSECDCDVLDGLRENGGERKKGGGDVEGL